MDNAANDRDERSTAEAAWIPVVAGFCRKMSAEIGPGPGTVADHCYPALGRAASPLGQGLGVLFRVR